MSSLPLAQGTSILGFADPGCNPMGREQGESSSGDVDTHGDVAPELMMFVQWRTKE